MYPFLGYFTNEDKYVIYFFLIFGQNLHILNAKSVTSSRQFVALLILPIFLSASKTGTSVVGQANKKGLIFCSFC